jgi:nucleoid-associated protein YgaU
VAIAHVVVVPQGFAHHRAPAEIYARRRWTLLVLSTMIVLALALGAGTALASRGGGPASTPAVRPPSAAAASVTGSVYIVQPGDSLWAIAGRIRGHRSITDELDRLIAANHGTVIRVGQALQLP